MWKALCSLLHFPLCLCSSCPFTSLPRPLKQLFFYKFSSLGNPLTAHIKGIALLWASSVYYTAPGEVVQEEEGMPLVSNAAYLLQEGMRALEHRNNSIPQHPQGSVKMIMSLIVAHLYWISLLSTDNTFHLLILILMKNCGADGAISNAVAIAPSPLGYFVTQGAPVVIFQILQRPTA